MIRVFQRRWLHPLFPLLLLAVAGCEEGGPSFSPSDPDVSVEVALATSVAPPGPGRLEVRLEAESGAGIGRGVATVSPGARSWRLDFPRLSHRGEVRVVGEITDPETGRILWQGSVITTIPRTGRLSIPLELRGGGEGPSVGGLSLRLPGPIAIRVGESLALPFEISDGTSPDVRFLSGDPTVVAVDSSGRITGLRAGAARIAALSGERSAEVDVEVSDRIVRLLVDPVELLLSEAGAEAELLVRGVGLAGQEVEVTESLLWSWDREGIASLDARTVRALRNGTAVLTARLPADSTVRGRARVTVRQAGATLRIESGDGQTGPIGHALPILPSVTVLDPGGRPAEGVEVVFSSPDTGGHTRLSRVVSGPDGLASPGPWTLGIRVGEQSLAASIPGAAVTLRADARPGSGSTLVVLSPEHFSGVVGAPVDVSHLPLLRVEDEGGNLVPGVRGRFELLGGDGRISGSDLDSDDHGHLRLGEWIHGSALGPEIIRATVDGFEPVLFRADLLAGPAVAIEAPGGLDRGTGEVDDVLDGEIEVRVADAYGHPVEGVPVAFTVTTGGGGVDHPVALTDSAGVATAGGWRLGTASGPQRLSAGIAGISPLTFSAEALPGPVDRLVLHPDTGVVHHVAGEVVVPGPLVQAEDRFGNAVPGALLVADVTEGGGALAIDSFLTGADGTVEISGWTLGTLAGARNAMTVESEGAVVVAAAYPRAGAPSPLRSSVFVGYSTGSEEVSLSGHLVDRFDNVVDPADHEVELSTHWGSLSDFTVTEEGDFHGDVRVLRADTLELRTATHFEHSSAGSRIARTDGTEFVAELEFNRPAEIVIPVTLHLDGEEFLRDSIAVASHLIPAPRVTSITASAGAQVYYYWGHMENRSEEFDALPLTFTDFPFSASVAQTSQSLFHSVEGTVSGAVSFDGDLLSIRMGFLHEAMRGDRGATARGAVRVVVEGWHYPDQIELSSFEGCVIVDSDAETTVELQGGGFSHWATTALPRTEGRYLGPVTGGPCAG